MVNAHGFSFEPASDGWTIVHGASEHPVRVRVRVIGESLRIVAISVGEDGPRRLTKRSLRDIPLDAIAESLYDYVFHKFEELRGLEGEELSMREQFGASGSTLDQLPPPPKWRSPDDPTHETYEQAQHAWLELIVHAQRRIDLESWLRASMAPGEVTPTARGRGAKPPEEADYRRFAAVYLEELAKAPSGAKSRTARRYGINRSTVYRWLEECHNRGILERSEG